MTPAQLSARLAQRAPEVVQYLYPNGRRTGQDYVIGGIDGDAGDSMKIHLHGQYAGYWKDWATDERGDLLDLWCVARGLDLPKAMEEVASYLGLRLDGERSRPKKQYRQPERHAATKRLNPDGPVMAYLKTRGLTETTLIAFKIAEQPGLLKFPELPQNPGTIVFPYLRDGRLVNQKYLALERPAGKKKMVQDKQAEPCLFGWQTLAPHTRWVVLTEGEIDAMTLYQVGIPALSVPNGGGSGAKQDWIESDFDHLQRFDTIYLGLDGDGPGHEGNQEILRRLGPERCRLVQWPHKDPNECLQQGFTKADFERCIHAAKTQDPEELKAADYYLDAVVNEFFPKPDAPQGVTTPWPEIDQYLRFRPGEVTIWGGYSGHGKALALDTPIPTMDGWRTMGDLQVGDFVFDENGNPCSVIALSEVWENRPCYQVVFSDGEIIIADAHHEWLTWSGRARQTYLHARINDRLGNRPLKKYGSDQRHKMHRPRMVTTAQIAETLLEEMGNRICKNHSIPVAGALKTPYRELPVDPYVLGLWLGDGDSYGGGFTTADTETLAAFQNAGFEVTIRQGKYHYGIRGLNTVLKTFGVYNNKHIPQVYLRSSYEQRLALLQGLMDTDGSVTGYGRCEFCGVNSVLAYQVLELVLSLGLQARLITSEARLNGKSCGVKYRVTFTPDIAVFRIQRKAERLKSKISDRIKRRYIVACTPVASVPVRCIQVDSASHLYLAGKSMIPTHNSLVLNHIAAASLARNDRWCIASMEMPPPRTLMRMVRQLTGREDPAQPYVHHAMRWLGERLWLFDLLGTAKVDRMLEVFSYAAKRYQIGQFIIDSLAKCGMDEDDYNAQKGVVERLSDFAHQHQAHIHLVCHARKGSNENSAPGKMDIKGTGAITDMADNVVTVWRNKAKEDTVNEAQRKKQPVDPEVARKADAVLMVSKQRHTGWEGDIGLWFHAQSLQYLKKADYHPRIYVLPVEGSVQP